MTHVDFSFADHALRFDEHITRSIPGYLDLRRDVVGLSRDFVQRGTTVLDIGCSTGALLREIRAANARDRSGVQYLGVDIEPEFARHWEEPAPADIAFRQCDATTIDFDHVSLATCLFTLQFLTAEEKARILAHVYRGLVPGGALILAEKLLSRTGHLQDCMAASYYGFKYSRLPADDILEKQQRLRGFMRPWTEDELYAALRKAGFQKKNIECFFRRGLFAGYIAAKR